MYKLDLKKSRSLLNVRRLNFERCNRYENVAEHSLYVGIIAYQLAYALEYGENVARHCLKLGIMHDLAEAVTGDIPFLTRRAMGDTVVNGLDYMGNQELGIDLKKHPYEHIVEVADILEFALYLQEEIRSGNTNLNDIYAETLNRLVGYLDNQLYRKYICDLLGMSSTEIIDNAKEMIDGIKH